MYVRLSHALQAADESILREDTFVVEVKDQSWGPAQLALLDRKFI